MKTKVSRTSEDDRINWLCDRLQEETDYSKFTALVRELNEALERKTLQARFDNPQNKKVA